MLQALAKEFREAIRKIERHGGSHHIDSSLVDLLMEETTLPVGEASRQIVVLGAKTSHFSGLAENETRDCLDPWRIAYVEADGGIRPCCFFEETLGMLTNASLEEIVEGSEFRKLRREILTGDLRPSCAGCQSRPVIDRGALQEMVRIYLHHERSRTQGSTMPAPPLL